MRNYTLCMRPALPEGTTKLSMVYTQEQNQWFETSTAVVAETYASCQQGLSFCTPLENVNITIHQLATLFSGIIDAYTDLLRKFAEEEADTCCAQLGYFSTELLRELCSEEMLIPCAPKTFAEIAYTTNTYQYLLERDSMVVVPAEDEWKSISMDTSNFTEIGKCGDWTVKCLAGDENMHINITGGQLVRLATNLCSHIIVPDPALALLAIMSGNKA